MKYSEGNKLNRWMLVLYLKKNLESKKKRDKLVPRDVEDKLWLDKMVKAVQANWGE